MAGLFGRSEEHAMLHDTMRRFGRDQSGLEQRHCRLASHPPDRMALWPNLAEIGVLAALVDEALGGIGGAARDLAVVQDALAPSLAVEPVLATALAARLLAHLPPDIAAPIAADMISGERIFVLAHAENFDPFTPPSARAEPENGGYRLWGGKPCVRHADVATDFLLSASLPDGEVGLFLVGAHQPGLSVAPIRLIDGAGAADLAFGEVRLDAGARLPLADAMEAVTDALEWGLAGLCAETASLTETAIRETAEYLNTREQFGTKLAQFQALQHRLADMAIAHEEATAMAEMAVCALAGPVTAERSRAILSASLACDAAGRRVGHEAVQMFGGMGVSDELAISHYARRFAAIRAQFGTVDARACRLTDMEGDLP